MSLTEDGVAAGWVMLKPAEFSWVDDVLAFWFSELDKEQWFQPDETVDRAIIDRFHDVYRAAADEPLARLLSGPRTALATVLLLDQMPRNMFRDDPRAYATDDKALAVTRHAVARRFDDTLDVDQRAFLYLPFEHSEDLADQATAVALFRRLGDATYLDFAEKHFAVIAQFGRFPHRNAVLGRETTPQEAAFLADAGRGF